MLGRIDNMQFASDSQLTMSLVVVVPIVKVGVVLDSVSVVVSTVVMLFASVLVSVEVIVVIVVVVVEVDVEAVVVVSINVSVVAIVVLSPAHGVKVDVKLLNESDIGIACVVVDISSVVNCGCDATDVVFAASVVIMVVSGFVASTVVDDSSVDLLPLVVM